MEDINSTAIPLCQVFGRCGGCCYQDISYLEELRLKQEKVISLMRDAAIAENVIDPIIASPKDYHYRNSLNLKLKKFKSTGNVEVGFTPIEGKGIIEITQCPIAKEVVSQYIPTLKQQAIKKLPEKYREANLTVLTGDDDRIFWGGIGKGSTSMKEENYLWVEINGVRVFYALDTFFQANILILPSLFKVLRAFKVWEERPVFFDLYGGVGLFSLCVHDLVCSTVLIEECVASVKLARYNALYHRLQNCEIIEGRVEKHLSALLEKYKGQTKVVMVDPPRGGLSVESRQTLVNAGFDHIFYLSCNPETLVRDLKDLGSQGWKVDKVILFDFFPRTKHIETLVSLQKGER
ncbi:MAG: class I SAM-dependent RNA methyltransferase [Candidatus Omnitrophica bacterium]|nr:class I SAM-dependent RNA methyltransferase [Candidatus Omnitrophota bacterium]